jgi:hypothetical protein
MKVRHRQLLQNIMKMNPSLSGGHQRAYEKIFQHPISHSLEWREVRSLFSKLGEVVEKPNGNLMVTRNGQTLVLHPTVTKDVADPDELMKMRHFLERSENSAPGSEAKEIHYLVTIDHHEARIFRTEMNGSVPQQILPHEPSEYFRHAHNSKDFSRGQEKPDPNTFFAPIAKALSDAGKILIFGSGTGTSSEMAQFVAWLNIHYRDTAKRIVGAEVVDGHHLSEAQLLAKARDFYAKG